MTDYRIRVMTLEDYDECYQLWRGVSEADGRVDCTHEVIKRILARNPDICFVVVSDNRIIGTITCEFGGDGAYISHLAVASAYRRQGIATALVSAAEDKLTSLGVRKSRILVFAHNENAKLFWRSSGYGIREDVVFMDKKMF
jgi:ribosomal protein S18 acetylase RimI-like enzyme